MEEPTMDDVMMYMDEQPGYDEDPSEQRVDHSQTRHIKITHHAQERLIERVRSYEGYRSWNDLVRSARYYGTFESHMTDKEHTWY